MSILLKGGKLTLETVFADPSIILCKGCFAFRMFNSKFYNIQYMYVACAVHTSFFQPSLLTGLSYRIGSPHYGKAISSSETRVIHTLLPEDLSFAHDAVKLQCSSRVYSNA